MKSPMADYCFLDVEGRFRDVEGAASRQRHVGFLLQ
jgi:hypothetical protein